MNIEQRLNLLSNAWMRGENIFFMNETQNCIVFRKEGSHLAVVSLSASVDPTLKNAQTFENKK